MIFTVLIFVNVQLFRHSENQSSFSDIANGVHYKGKHSIVGYILTLFFNIRLQFASVDHDSKAENQIIKQEPSHKLIVQEIVRL